MFDDILFPKKDVYLPEDVEECKACMGAGHDLHFEPCPVCGGAGEVQRVDNGFACMISLRGRTRSDMDTEVDKEHNATFKIITRLHPCKEGTQ